MNSDTSPLAGKGGAKRGVRVFPHPYPAHFVRHLLPQGEKGFAYQDFCKLITGLLNSDRLTQPKQSQIGRQKCHPNMLSHLCPLGQQPSPSLQRPGPSARSVDEASDCVWLLLGSWATQASAFGRGLDGPRGAAGLWSATVGPGVEDLD